MGKKFLVFFMLLIVISSGLIGCFGEEKYGPLIRENSVPEEKKQSKENISNIEKNKLVNQFSNQFTGIINSKNLDINTGLVHLDKESG